MFELMSISMGQLWQDLYIYRVSVMLDVDQFTRMILGVLEHPSRPDDPDSTWHDTRQSLMSAFSTVACGRDR